MGLFSDHVVFSNKDGWTPLMIACDNGHIEVVSILLENMANIEATDEVGGFVLKDGLVHWTLLISSARARLTSSDLVVREQRMGGHR
jgi:hypothetical protein